MPEVIISLDGHDEELAVFGSRDQHLRQIRDAFGVKVLARHGEVRIEGDRERIDQAKLVFEQLRDRFRLKRPTSSSDIADIIEGILRVADPERPEQIEIREGGRVVRPRTDGQERYLKALRDKELVFCIGPAGTGKTYLAVATAVAALRRSKIKKIVLVRPAVEAGEKLGFLPGDLEAKINPYLRPLLDALHDLMDYDQIRRYMDSDLIEIAPLAYMRGRTLNDAVIILDEGQNATVPQMKMFLTRMGQNARIVVTGDITQVDLPIGTVNGLAHAVELLGGVEGVGAVQLGRSDIVRHPLVQAIVNAYEAAEQPRDASPGAAPAAGFDPEPSRPVRDRPAPSGPVASG
jgi:phosphate starvation-inducible PhoH-like protein